MTGVDHCSQLVVHLVYPRSQSMDVSVVSNLGLCD